MPFGVGATLAIRARFPRPANVLLSTACPPAQKRQVGLGHGLHLFAGSELMAVGMTPARVAFRAGSAGVSFMARLLALDGAASAQLWARVREGVLTGGLNSARMTMVWSG